MIDTNFQEVTSLPPISSRNRHLGRLRRWLGPVLCRLGWRWT